MTNYFIFLVWMQFSLQNATSFHEVFTADAERDPADQATKYWGDLMVSVFLGFKASIILWRIKLKLRHIEICQT
ncbi:MAG: hypothetical protein HC871_06210 [Rhizobiales bacterium]|nr:hypothetical protein [Hyphomicrobiales bacterium]